jgi:hypothetical protein
MERNNLAKEDKNVKIEEISLSISNSIENTYFPFFFHYSPYNIYNFNFDLNVYFLNILSLSLRLKRESHLRIEFMITYLTGT